MKPLAYSLFFFLAGPPVLAADPTPLQMKVEGMLPAGCTAAQDVPAAFEGAILDSILGRPDPETFFNRYIYGLQRHEKELLTPSQAMQLKEIIQQRSPIGNRWHDERNVLRCKFNEVMWLYAAASDAEANMLRDELAGWMRLRMLWTHCEHMAQHDFDRLVWQILDSSQQSNILAGQWKSYAKLDTGHTRANATAKLVSRALGQPDRREDFIEAVSQWGKQREPLHRALHDSEHAARRAGFAMDINSRSLISSLTDKANSTYVALYLAEAEAMRRLVRVGYARPEAGCRNAAAEAWGEAPRRFQAGASQMISLLSTSKD